MKTHLLKKGFHFFTHFNSILFLHSICTIQATSSIFNHFLTSFAIFHAFHDLFWAKWPWNWQALQMNSEKVETWHGFIISATYHVLKSCGGYGKNWIHFMYKLDNLFWSYRVSDENSSITKGISFFNIF